MGLRMTVLKRHRHSVKANSMGTRFQQFFSGLPFQILPGENVSCVRDVFTGLHASGWEGGNRRQRKERQGFITLSNSKHARAPRASL